MQSHVTVCNAYLWPHGDDTGSTSSLYWNLIEICFVHDRIFYLSRHKTEGNLYKQLFNTTFAVTKCYSEKLVSLNSPLKKTHSQLTLHIFFRMNRSYSMRLKYTQQNNYPLTDHFVRCTHNGNPQSSQNSSMVQFDTKVFIDAWCKRIEKAGHIQPRLVANTRTIWRCTWSILPQANMKTTL